MLELLDPIGQFEFMNKLTAEDRARILHLLCEGQSIRAITRGVIGMDGDYVWRTNRRIASVDPAVGGETLPQNSEDAAKSSDLLAEVSGSFG